MPKYINSATKEQLNSLRGYNSKMAGETFESMINVACEHYKSQKIAYIEKTPEAFKVTNKKQTSKCFIFEGVFTKKCQPDYKGTLCGGRAVCFEAKHTDSEEIKQSRVSEEQRDSLEMHEQLGAKAFILISIRMQSFYRVPWSTWKDMKNSYGRKYINMADLEEYRIPYIAGILQFLKGMEW